LSEADTLNHISAVNIAASAIAAGAQGDSRHARELLPRTNPGQGHRISPELQGPLHAVLEQNRAGLATAQARFLPASEIAGFQRGFL
jgi:hypothetical protein